MKNLLLTIGAFSVLLGSGIQAAGKKTSNTKGARQAEKKQRNALKKQQEAYLKQFRLEVASGNGRFGNSILNLKKMTERYANIEKMAADLAKDPYRYEVPIHEMYDTLQGRIWRRMALKHFSSRFFDEEDGSEMQKELEKASHAQDALFSSKESKIQQLLKEAYKNEEIINPLFACQKITHNLFKAFLEEESSISSIMLAHQLTEEKLLEEKLAETDGFGGERIHKMTLHTLFRYIEFYSKSTFRVIFCNSLLFAKKNADLFQITQEEKKKLDAPLLLEYYNLNKKIVLVFQECLDEIERYFNAVYFSQQCIVKNKLFLEEEVLVDLPEIALTLALPQPLKTGIERVAHNLFRRKKIEQAQEKILEEKKRVEHANLKKQKKDQKHGLVKAFDALSLSEEVPSKSKLDVVDVLFNSDAADIEMDEKENSYLQKIVTDWINYGKWIDEGFNIVERPKLALNKERVLDHVEKHFVQDSEIDALLQLNGRTLEVCKDRTENESLLAFFDDEAKGICSSFVVSNADSFEQYLERLLEEEHTTHKEEAQEILTFSRPIPVLKFKKFKDESMIVEHSNTNEVYVHYNNRKELRTVYPKVN